MRVYGYGLILALLAPGLRAQEKQSLTVEDAISIAMKNNIEVISAQNAYNTAVANVLPKTWGNNLPTVDLNARYSRADQKTTFYTSSGTIQSANSYGYSLDANYILFDGLKKYGQMAQAKYDERSALFDQENTRQGVILKVYQAYITVLKNQQLLVISEENLKRDEEQLKRIEERNRLGAQILSDVYKQRVLVGSDKLALNQAKNNLNTAKASLNSLIGLDVNTDIELKELGQDISFDASQFNFDGAFQQGLQNRKDYLASMKRLESARSGLRNARGGYFPTISAFATYSWQDGVTPFSSTGKQNYNLNDRVQFGLQLTMPLFNGFQTSAGVIQADQSVQTARSNVDNMRRTVALDVKVAILNLQTTFENVKLSEENLASAKEDLRLATEKYNVGAGTILDQITANTSYATAEAGHIQATYDFLYARQQYLLAIGAVNVQ